jgi:glycosyltransferase involved in cell wall biosynthesis
MKEMSVALISSTFPPNDFGGISSHCYDLAYSLSKNHVRTTVFCGGRHMTNEKLGNNLEVFRLPVLDLPPRHLWFQLCSYKALSPMLAPCTILHGHHTPSAFCVKFRNNWRKPLVVTVHNMPYYDLNTFFKAPFSDLVLSEFFFDFIEYPLNDALMKFALKGSDHVVACGSSTLDHIKTIYKDLHLDQISMVPNGINFDKLDSLETAPLRTEESKDKIQIFFCGRLYWRKGIIHLVKAMSEKVLKLISDLKLRKYIDVRGIVSYSELIAQLKGSDIAVFPSFYEVGPFISALEAMACKKPTVTFDFPFAREFITHMSTGILARPGDVKDLSNKLYLLATDANLRNELGKRAFDHVRVNYNWDILVKKYIDVYKSLSD